MKILLIAHDTRLNSGWGRHVTMIMREYDKQGVEYSVLTESSQCSHEHEKNALQSTDSFFSFLHNIKVIRQVSRGYDIVHAFDIWPYGLYGFAAVLGRKSRLFLNGIGTYSVAPLYIPIKRLLLKIVFLRTEKIFCISNYTKDELIKAVPKILKKLTVVYLGATALPKPSILDIESVRAKYSITGSPIILSVGAIKERKGQFDTLQAVAVLKKQYPNITYLIVGSKGDYSYLEQMNFYIRKSGLENSVRIIDTIDSDEQLAALYSISDVFALNSNNDNVHHHFEGFGLVFLEAYQFGVPGVGSRDCGIEDAIEDKKTGFLTQQGDSEDIAQGIQSVLGNREFFSKNATVFEKRFTWDLTAHTYRNAYEQGIQV